MFTRTYWRVKKYNILAWLYDVRRYYYRSKRFALADMLMNMSYLYLNPYYISRKFSERNKDASSNTYGETPLKSLEILVDHFNIIKPKKILELGCGRGKTLFWLADRFDVEVVGIEMVPFFVHQANRIKDICRYNNMKIYRGDMFSFNMSSFDLIYCYGTCFDDKQIKDLLYSFKMCQRKTKIVTISYPLEDYDKSFTTESYCEVSFPWGTTMAYLNSHSG